MSSAYATPLSPPAYNWDNRSSSGQSSGASEQITNFFRKFSLSRSYIQRNKSLSGPIEGLSSAGPILSLSPSEESKFRLVESLQKGWDGGTAEPVDTVAVEAARDLLLSLRSEHVAAQDARVLPIADGRIQLEWHDKDRSLEFEFVGPGWIAVGVDSSDKSGGPRFFNVEISQLDAGTVSDAYDWFVQRDPRIAPWPSR
jgi:hypothetical protein